MRCPRLTVGVSGLDSSTRAAAEDRVSFTWLLLALFPVHPRSRQAWRIGEGLHDDAVLLGLLLQSVELLGGRFGGFYLQNQANVLEADRNFFGDPHGAGEV